MIDKQSRQTFPILVLITVASLFVYFVIVTTRTVYSFDESYTMALIRYSFVDIWRITSLDVHPPLYCRRNISVGAVSDSSFLGWWGLPMLYSIDEYSSCYSIFGCWYTYVLLGDVLYYSSISFRLQYIYKAENERICYFSFYNFMRIIYSILWICRFDGNLFSFIYCFVFIESETLVDAFNSVFSVVPY